MSMDYSDPDFLELRKQWYKRLEAEGFNDIEYTDWNTGESGNLLEGITTGQLVRREAKQRVGSYKEPQQRSSHRADTQAPGSMVEEIGRYYQLCEHWKIKLEGEGWPSTYRRVWAMHTEGTPYARIAQQVEWSRGYVSRWIRFQERRMLNLKPDGTPAREPVFPVFVPVTYERRRGLYRVIEIPTRRVATASDGQKIDRGGIRNREVAKNLSRRVNAGANPSPDF